MVNSRSFLSFRDLGYPEVELVIGEHRRILELQAEHEGFRLVVDITKRGSRWPHAGDVWRLRPLHSPPGSRVVFCAPHQLVRERVRPPRFDVVRLGHPTVKLKEAIHRGKPQLQANYQKMFKLVVDLECRDGETPQAGETWILLPLRTPDGYLIFCEPVRRVDPDAVDNFAEDDDW